MLLVKLMFMPMNNIGLDQKLHLFVCLFAWCFLYRLFYLFIFYTVEFVILGVYGMLGHFCSLFLFL